MRAATWRFMAASAIGRPYPGTWRAAEPRACPRRSPRRPRRPPSGAAPAPRQSARAIADCSCGSGLRDKPELAHQPEFVQAAPALDDAAVAQAPDVDPRKAERAVRRRHAEQLTLVRAAGREVLDDQIALAVEDVHVAVPVGARGAEQRPGRPHALPVGRDADRRVMVDEVLGEIRVDRGEVTLGEQGVDEEGDGVLVLADRVHDRSLRRSAAAGYPNYLGLPAPVTSLRRAPPAAARRRRVAWVAGGCSASGSDDAAPALPYTIQGSPCARSSTDRASDYGSEGWGFESLRARSSSRRSGPCSIQLAGRFTIGQRRQCHIPVTRRCRYGSARPRRAPGPRVGR